MGSHQFTAQEIIDFGRQFDPQPFHVDPEAAGESLYGEHIASGWHTCCVAMRLMCDSYVNRTRSLGSPGVDNIRWLAPVKAGDTLTDWRTALEARASRSRPDAGLVRNRWEAYNQDGVLVMSMEGWGMLGRRPR
ncbi:MAG: MaoC family dehydratase [bacterium]